MTRITKVKTGSQFERTGSYSRVVAVDNWIFVSNTAGRNPETKVIADELIAQGEQMFANIAHALEAVDASLSDVISARIFIQDPADTPAFMAFFGRRFKGVDPTVTVTCPPLGSTVYRVEMEVTAFRGAGNAETQVLTLG